MDNPAIDEKFSISYETLWKAIIRPPRDDYTEEDLIEPVFTYRGKTYLRKDYDLLSSQGYILKCSFIEPDDESRPTAEMPVVIYLHGNSSSRLEGLRMLHLLIKLDINLFVFDFAGSGLSGGEYISLGYHEQNDVRIIVDFVEKLPGVGKIGLWGRSMGAATTMLYAHTDERVEAIVMDSPFTDFKRLAKEMCQSMVKIPGFLVDVALGIVNRTVKNKNGMDVNKLRPIDAAELTTTPAIFIHAMTDELIPFQHSMDLCEKYAGEKSLKSCDGGHNSKRPREILDTVGQFFCEHLKQGYKDTTNEIIPVEEKKEKKESEGNLIEERSSEDDTD